MIKYLLIFAIVFLINSCHTHEIRLIKGNGKLVHKVEGTYRNKSAQGMAINKDIAFLFNDGGHFRVYDLKTSVILKEGDLASASKTCHVNSACFSNQFYKDSPLPLLYITEYLGDRRCFVEYFNNDYESVLAQTISYQKNGKPVFVWNWSVDAKGDALYALNNVSMQKSTKNVVNRVVKFKLPKLADGDKIILTENDVVDTYDVNFANGVQGGKIKNGYWYISTGLHERNKDKFDAERAIIVIDLKKRRIDRIVDLSSITQNEPEDIDFYGKKILLYCGQTGGLYDVNEK